MNAISSIQVANPDTSAIDLRAMACDVGEAVLLLSGGIREPHRVAALCANLRNAQSYLVKEASEQAGREAIAEDAVLVAVVARFAQPVSLSPLPGKARARNAVIAGRFKRFYDRAEQPDVRAALAAYHMAYPLAEDALSYEDARRLVGELDD